MTGSRPAVRFSYSVSVKKLVGKDLAVFSKIDFFLKKECAGGTWPMRKNSQTEKTIKDYRLIY